MNKVRFSDVLTIINGRNQKRVENPNGKYPIYGSGGIMGYADDYICDKETVVIGRKGNINNPIYVETPFWNVDTAFGLYANEEKLFPKYLFYFCEKFNFEHLNTTVTIPSLTKANLLKIEMLLPSLEEQQKKAFVLDKVSNLIALRKQQLAKLDELVKSRFVEMFGDKAAYASEPLGNNVEEMFIGPFGSSLKNDCFVPQEKAFCMVYEQKHAIQKTMNVETRYVSEAKYKELKRFSVHGGDIIVSCRGTIGEVFVIPDNAPLGIMHPSIMKIRLNASAYTTKFFAKLLERYMQLHSEEANGSGVKMAVTATTLGKELFCKPPITVQNEFSTFLEKTDKTKSSIQKSLAETQLLFDSLMQTYFG